MSIWIYNEGEAPDGDLIPAEGWPDEFNRAAVRQALAAMPSSPDAPSLDAGATPQ